MAHQIEQIAYVGETLGMALGINSVLINRLKSGQSRQAWIGGLNLPM
jgi:hypothetical protein